MPFSHRESSMSDQVEIVLTAAVAAGLVGLVGWGLVRWIGRRSIRAAAILAAITTVVAVTAGVVATADRMFLSDHDLGVVLIVCAAAGVVAIGVGMALGMQVAELQAQSLRLAEQREREAALEQSRRDLVAWVSHDLRTPLAGLRAMAEALEDDVAEDPARYHHQIRLEVDRLSALVDDLFQLSRIQAGALKLAHEQVLAADLVSDAIAAADPLATANGVRLSGSSSGPLPVSADSRQLGRALANLVVNAVRHTPADGAVTVVAASDPGTGGVVLSVTDSCGGIDEADLARVFDVAWRGNAERNPDAGGGLGLAIVRGIAEAHGGEVSVRNVDGGCRFDLHIPARR
jgi:signal transduction histidine kinase